MLRPLQDFATYPTLRKQGGKPEWAINAVPPAHS